MRRLHKLLRLPFREQLLLLEALVAVTTVRLALWVLPFRFIRARIVQARGGRDGSSRVDDTTSLRVARAVTVVSRYVPRATCLTQAVATLVLLRRAGCDAQLRIGVRRGDNGEFAAHAWVESAGAVVIGGTASPDKFVRLPLSEAAIP